MIFSSRATNQTRRSQPKKRSGKKEKCPPNTDSSRDILSSRRYFVRRRSYLRDASAIIPVELSSCEEMLRVTPTSDELWMLLSSLTGSTLCASVRRARIKGPTRVPSRRLPPLIGRAAHSRVLLGIGVFHDFNLGKGFQQFSRSIWSSCCSNIMMKTYL